MNVAQLINLLEQIPNKESEVLMWAYGEGYDEYLPIESVNIQRGDGNIIFSPDDSHKINDYTLTIANIDNGEV